ncbi:hypothetical protein OPQ81_010278 [Rhizoctonia solani]|nr:hypothetical protein OPQ81_010278 [Rhizoctonia solani]
MNAQRENHFVLILNPIPTRWNRLSLYSYEYFLLTRIRYTFCRSMMPSPNKLPPGPAGTSCLTCKRRHKKCDRQRPVCDRCSKGGYECLGYGHNKPNGCTWDEALLSDHAKLDGSRSGAAGLATSPPFRNYDSPRNDETSTPSDIIDSHNRAGHLIQPSTAHKQQDLSNLLAFYDEAAVIYDTFPPTRSKTRVMDNELPRSFDRTDALIAQQPIRSASPLLLELTPRISKSLPTPPEVHDITEYVISHLDRMFQIIYFKPRVEQIEKFRRLSIWRMYTCSFARQGMLIDARIHESVIEGSHPIYSSEFTSWIEGFEEAVRARLDKPLSSYELRERLNDILEMFFTKGRLLNAATRYGLFCRAAPSFLQMVYSDPTLSPIEPHPTLVSIAHLLASSRYGPACYALMDVKGSMVYGVPQILDYNTGIELFHAEPHPLEWFDCFPGEFLIPLAKINVCRDQNSTESWRNIEQELVSWEPRPKFDPKGLESWKLIAWRALQETWRHTLLIYLYLAVCGVLTNDPRIQSSLRQILRLLSVIRRQDPPISNVHIFSQCVIAGICSRTEKQRKLVRERLGCSAATRLWMFRGPEIVPVLDHLWLGVGMGGRPVTWRDYIHSRQAMLPLSG